MAEHTFKRYHYDPSLAAAVIFAVIYGLSGLMHAFQIFKFRTWYFTSFFIGVLFEFVGYIARSINANQSPDWAEAPFIVQTLLLLVAPALYAASIYMILGRLIRSLEAERLSLIRTNWLTKIFVLGDVLSFLVQAGGGTIVANAKSASAIDRGQNLVLVGLGIQILFFGLFIVAISIFHVRIVRQPTTASLETLIPWRRYLLILYAASFLIMVRSIFRVAEFAAGTNSVLQNSEAYLYCLDAALMLICAVLFNVQHPSLILQTTRYKTSPNHVELMDA